MGQKRGDDLELYECLTTFNSNVRIPMVSPPYIACKEYVELQGIDL